MQVKLVSIALVIVVLLAILLAACSAAAPTAEPTAVPSAAVSPTAAPATHAQAAAGKSTFESFCTCHAPPSKQALSKYSTAQTLYNFISTRMPPSNANVVTDAQRYDIIAYLLFARGLIQANQPVNADTLASISIPK